VVLEASFNTRALADLLQAHAGRVIVSNPLHTKAIASAKVKTDKVDAQVAPTSNQNFPIAVDTSAVIGVDVKFMVAWDQVTRSHVLRGIREYDRLGPERFFSEHGFAATTTYELVWDDRRYPPKAILGTAYEFATGRRLASGDFEGGKTGAVRVLGKLGFTIQARRPAR
jgi:hypothetical protein